MAFTLLEIVSKMKNFLLLNTIVISYSTLGKEIKPLISHQSLTTRVVFTHGGHFKVSLFLTWERLSFHFYPLRQNSMLKHLSILLDTLRRKHRVCADGKMFPSWPPELLKWPYFRLIWTSNEAKFTNESWELNFFSLKKVGGMAPRLRGPCVTPCAIFATSY